MSLNGMGVAKTQSSKNQTPGCLETSDSLILPNFRELVTDDRLGSG